MDVTVYHVERDGSFGKVAVVAVPDMSMEDALEFVFCNTQNAFDSWSRGGGRDYLTYIAPLPVVNGQTLGHRSTSVGDLMVVGETVYRVEPCGFSEHNAEGELHATGL